MAENLEILPIMHIWHTNVYRMEARMLQDLTGGNPVVVVIVFIAVVWVLISYDNGSNKADKDKK